MRSRGGGGAGIILRFFLPSTILLCCFGFASPCFPGRGDFNEYGHDGPPPSANMILGHGIDWIARGEAELEEALNRWPKWKSAKNVILFIGDGMGIPTLTAARFFQAQYTDQRGRVEDAKLSWEDFPFTGLIKVHVTRKSRSLVAWWEREWILLLGQTRVCQRNKSHSKMKQQIIEISGTVEDSASQQVHYGKSISIYYRLHVYRPPTNQNANDIDFDLSLSLKAQSDGSTVLSIVHDFLLVIYSNVSWPNLGPLWDISLLNLSDLDFQIQGHQGHMWWWFPTSV